MKVTGEKLAQSQCRHTNDRCHRCDAELDPIDEVALWDAINAYVLACGGNPSSGVYGNTGRQKAVVSVTNAIRPYLASNRTKRILNARAERDGGAK